MPRALTIATATLIAAITLSGLTRRALAAPPATSAPAKMRVALLPTELLNLTPAEGRHLRQRLVSILHRRRQLALLGDTQVGEVLLDHPKDCATRPACQRRLAKTLGVARLLILRAGQLGQTLMLRLTLYDAEGVKRGSWQEVLHEHSDVAIARSLERMVDGLAPRPQALAPRGRPWYRRWWIWTAIGALVAGTVTTTVLLTRARNPHADVGIVLPPP